jgi:hypothetical protein
VDAAALFLSGTAALEAKRLNASLQPDPIGISDAYLIGQALPIGALTDLASAMLDALESVFVLYDNETERENESGGDTTPPLRAPETQPPLLARME